MKACGQPEEEREADDEDGAGPAGFSIGVTSCYLIGVQLALVDRVGVLDDLDLVLPEALAVETLRETGTEASSTALSPSTQRWSWCLPPACERFQPAW